MRKKALVLDADISIAIGFRCTQFYESILLYDLAGALIRGSTRFLPCQYKNRTQGPVFILVRESDTFWNPFLESVLKVDAKLTNLGFQYREGNATYPEASNEFEDSG